MEPTSPAPKERIGTTLRVSVVVVVVVGLLEIAVLAWALAAHFRNPNSSLLSPLFAQPGKAAPAIAAQTAASGKLESADPLAMPEEAAPTPDSPSFPRPTPVPVARKEQSATQSRALELVQQARSLRDAGDTLTALTRLREAQAFAPDLPEIISEMAITYEKMGAVEKARDQWRRIYLLGESAGIYYAAAEAKLNRTGGVGGIPESAASQDSGIGLIGLQQQPLPAPVAATAPESVKDEAGFPPKASLALAGVEREERSDPAAQTHFVLKVPVKSRAGEKIDVHEVVIQAFFYDLLDGQTIVPTSANVSSQWITAPTDWTEENMEILELEYALPKAAAKAAAAAAGSEKREYLGYLARIYYKKALQDMRAEPASLLQQFPPPPTLPTEDSR